MSSLPRFEMPQRANVAPVAPVAPGKRTGSERETATVARLSPGVAPVSPKGETHNNPLNRGDRENVAHVAPVAPHFEIALPNTLPERDVNQALRSMNDADRETVALTLYERRLRVALATPDGAVPSPPRGLSTAGHADAWHWHWTAIELHRRRKPWPYAEPEVVTTILQDAGISPGCTECIL